MDKKLYLSSFNDHFEEMLVDISRIYPEDSDIKKVYTYLSGIRVVNVTKIHKIFRESVINKYRKNIMNNEIDFFLDKDYSEDLTSKFKDKVNEKLDFLKSTIRKMELNEQQKIIQYLKNLISLSDLYIQSK